MSQMQWPPVVPKWRALINAARFIQNPIPILSGHLEEYGNSYTFYMGGMKKSIVTADAEFVQHVLQKNHRNYQKSYIQTETLAEYIGHGLLTTTGPYWLRQRRLIQPGFRKAKLEGLTGLMREQIRLTFDEIPLSSEGEQIVDAYDLMHKLAFRIIAKSLFSAGIDGEGMYRLNQLIETIQSFIIREVRQPFFHWWFRMSGKIEKHIALAGKTKRFIQQIIDTRRASADQPDDLLQMLLDARYEDGSKMTDQQLLDECLILFLAGHETTVNAMAWTIYLLSQHPAVFAKLRREIQAVSDGAVLSFEKLRELHYTRQVLEESMRIYPPAWVSDRVALNDDEVCGFKFPAGTIVILYFYGLHHNKQYWKDPEIFDPDRFSGEARKSHRSYAYVPFGGGPRLCIGHHFAMMEMQLTLAEFVNRFDIGEIQKEIELQPLITLKPRDGIPVRLTKSTRKG